MLDGGCIEYDVVPFEMCLTCNLVNEWNNDVLADEAACVEEQCDARNYTHPV